MTQIRYDVIVVGGGPAGSATATHLAREGFAVLLLERAEFPRDKPCGEFFSPPVRGLLNRLGAYDELLAAGVRDVSGARLLTIDGDSFTGSFQEANHPWSVKGGFSVERRVLDHVLWQNALRSGADGRTGVTLRGLKRNGDGAVTGVQTNIGDFESSVVVGADGSKSRVARELDLVRPLPRLQKLGLIAHYTGVREEATPSLVEMYVGHGRLTCGFGPQPKSGANVTLEVPESEARSIAAVGAEAYADEILRTHFPGVVQRLTGARRTRLKTCGTFGHTCRTPVADGALLVGDAAEFIDPFTGEGVYFALRSAELAAETITAALRRGNTSAYGLRTYVAGRRRELAPKYTLCGLIERAVHTPGLMRAVAPKLGRAPHLMDELLGVTGDMHRPQRLLTPKTLWAVLTA